MVTFLNKMGANIKWLGKRKIKIIGSKNFKSVNYSIMFDRIEAGTFIIAGAAISKKMKITGIETKILKELQILKNGSKV